MLLLTRIISFAFIFNQIPIYLAGKSKSLPVSSACAGLQDGLYPDPSSCRRFIHCHQNGQAAYKTCPPSTLFNPSLKVCDWASKVKCSVHKRVPNVVPSKPRSFIGTEINGTTLHLTWDPPSRYSKPLLRYVIGYQRKHTGSSNKSRVIVQPSVLSYTLSGLLPGSNYLIEIQAVNGAGHGGKATLMANTPLEVPQEPSNLSAKPLGPTAIILKWKEPKLRNDQILSYTITYGIAGLTLGQNSFSLHGYANTAILSNLMPGMEYEIKVQALSFGGFGKPAVIRVLTPSGDLCSPGHYSETGKKPCWKCTYGRYQSRTGQTRCLKCPRGTITLKQGAISMKECAKVTTD
ncbi:tenascin-like [Actinia tenebrosa]|uniref:Tenascin-like n=1 Tax=Actinia tenebrosa TaxID=6105 RepID=A0A6P8IWC6_ACTTE|nr:tenascin-like [Actinia tenebrosa]XP_031570363.1 tenascin-like [Actinia tenebrosa]